MGGNFMGGFPGPMGMGPMRGGNMQRGGMRGGPGFPGQGFGPGGPARGGMNQPGSFTQGGGHPGMQQPRPGNNPVGLSSSDLSKLPPEEQKNALGEKLYVKIHEVNPQQAPKITGMLLEMDIPEILNVLEDRAMLIHKVQEAVSVLQRHEKH